MAELTHRSMRAFFSEPLAGALTYTRTPFGVVTRKSYSPVSGTRSEPVQLILNCSSREPAAGA
jgi:hypothetical protein